ncbi:MAG: GNAT family N-acetyltransferase [Solirubrobacteraceae bacterium]
MLRPAAAADAPAALELIREGFASYRAFGIPGWEPPDEPMHGFAERLAAGWGAVVEDGGEVVGFGAFEQALEHPRAGAEVPGLAHVWAVFVTQTHWGTEVATTLLAALTEEIGRQGYIEARLFTPAPQARARRFYAREGWHEAGEPVHVEALGLDMVELRRPV